MSTQNLTDRPAYGLHALMDDAPSVPLPLKAVDARFEVSGDCAQVMLEQIFEFDGANPVDILYTFPLPSEASVHYCAMNVGGRRVVATVKAIKEAREDFRKAHDAGKRAAIVETVRENLFELQLGNVQPGDQITLALSYVMPLAAEGRQRRLRIPVCPGIRFIPGRPEGINGDTDLVPDAGRLLPIRIDDQHPDAAAFFCAGTLAGAAEINSPSHTVEILTADPDKRIPVLLNDDSEVPDRDFVLTWEAPATTLALMGRDDPDYLLCSVQAPEDFPSGREGRDIFFLLDSSGSMTGRNWSSLVVAVDLALAELDPKDRFSVDLFASDLQTVTNGLIPADGDEAGRIVNQLRNHTPGGGTQFTNAFATIIDQAGKARRPVIVVVTDGQFGDEARACSVARDCQIEVHTVGIDACVNESALQKIARRTRGTCSLCVPGEDLGKKVTQLVSNLLSPAINRISAGAEWSLVGNPPPLRPGQASLVPFQRKDGKRKVDHPTEIEIEMNFTDGSFRRQALNTLVTSGRAPAILAAKAGITAHLDEDETAQALELACRFNVICEGAAFIAVDEADKVPVAAATYEQPSLEPSFARTGSMGLYRKVVGKQTETRMQSLRCSLNEPTRRFGSVASRNNLKPPISTQERLVRKLKKLASRFLNPTGTPSNQSERWLDSSARISCFDLKKWRKLLKRQLIPWATKSPANARLLDRLLRDLIGIRPNRNSPEAVLSCFDSFLPFLPEELRAETLEFLSDQKPSPSKKASI